MYVNCRNFQLQAEFFELRNYCDTLETKEVHQADIDRLCADAAVLAKVFIIILLF